MKYLLLGIALILSSCGRSSAFNCETSYAPPEIRFFGPYEEARCQAGESLLSAKLERLADGTPKRLAVECAKVGIKCE